jgi:hypothetical protein
VTSYRLPILALLMVVCAAVSFAGFARAQTAAPSSSLEAEKLEQAFTDPLTTLPQVVIRDAYSPSNYGTSDQFNQVLIRPLIPRIPPRTVLPFNQLIRPTFALVTVPSARGGVRTEFGDLPVFDVAVLPWPNREKTGVTIGVGPSFVFPTATSDSAGQGAWQAGPALGAIYSGIPGLLVGVVVQNPISFAYESRNRPPQNTLQVQPVFALHLWHEWYLRSAEATWTMGWHRNTPTMMPLCLGIGRTVVSPGLPPMSFFVTGQGMLYRQYAPVAPQVTINFGMTIAFPDLKDYWIK